jgi:hypothetical protein
MTKVFQTIEFKFWNFAVQVLSENETIRSIIRSTYQLIHDPAMTSNRVLIGLISVAGLFCGISLSILMTVLA